MTDADPRIERRRLEFRVILIALGGVQLLNGLHALFAPRSFYEDFPFGRGWVEALPAYNEHLLRDVGSLFVATGLLMLAAAWFLRRRLTLVALVAWVCFAIPHFVFHAFNLEPFGPGDVIGNVVALAFTVIAPLWLLAELARGEAVAAPRGGTAAGAGSGPAAAAGRGENGRIPGVPETTRDPIIRAAYRSSRRKTGAVVDPLRMFAHHRTLMLGYGAMETATERADRVPLRLKHLAEMRAAMLAGCEWCLDFGSSASKEGELSEDELRDLPLYATSERFTELERLVLDYATGMSRTPVDVPDEMFARLREHFDEAQLVELTSVIAIENYRARFNWALGLESQGFSEGSYCVRPEAAGDIGPGDATPAPLSPAG